MLDKFIDAYDKCIARSKWVESTTEWCQAAEPFLVVMIIGLNIRSLYNIWEILLDTQIPIPHSSITSNTTQNYQLNDSKHNSLPYNIPPGFSHDIEWK